MEVLISIITTIVIYLLCNKIKEQNESIDTLRKLHRSGNQLRNYAIRSELAEEDKLVVTLLESIRENKEKRYGKGNPDTARTN